jgi:hypothetical protein
MMVGLAAQICRETDPAPVHALCVTWLDLGRRLSSVAAAKIENILEFQ